MTTDNEDAPVRVEPKGKRGGVWVTLGDEQYRLPPLGLGTLRDPEFAATLETLGSIKGLPTPEQIGCAVRFIHTALVRNYPDVSVDEVEAMIDLGNLEAVLTAALGVSGFRPGGGRTSGETKASTGTAPTSP